MLVECKTERMVRTAVSDLVAYVCQYGFSRWYFEVMSVRQCSYRMGVSEE